MPLYPIPTIFLSSFTMHAPTYNTNTTAFTIWEFRVQLTFTGPRPRKFVITASGGHSVVSNPDNLLVAVYYARPNLHQQYKSVCFAKSDTTSLQLHISTFAFFPNSTIRPKEWKFVDAALLLFFLGLWAKNGFGRQDAQRSPVVCV